MPLVLALVLTACAPEGAAPSRPAPASGPSDVWLAEVSARLADGARAFRPSAEGFVATAGPLRGTFGEFVELTADTPVSLRTVGFGRPGALEDPGAAAWVPGECVPGRADPTGACIRRLERGPEWWVGIERGFEQGWTFAEAPEGAGPLIVAVETAAAVRAEGESLVLDEVLRVDGLIAYDADGDLLPAALQVTGAGFRVVVDDAGARYPVEIDPVYSSATWSVDGVAGNDPFAMEVSAAGDIDGDGFADVAVGAYDYGDGQGAVFVYLGSASGLSTTAAAVAEGPTSHCSSGCSFGLAIGHADVNGDGYEDLVVGGSGYWAQIGIVYVFEGSALGLDTTAATTLTGSFGTYFGAAVAGAGDVNGDGYDDVVVGAPEYSSGAGAAWLYPGSASGLSSTAATTISGVSGSELGYAVGGAGDVNGDGYDDVIVGAPYWSTGYGRAYVHHGSASGLSSSAATTLTAATRLDCLGWAVDGAGDVDGDGYDDVIVGAPGTSSGYGAAYIFQGSASGVGTASTSTITGSLNASLGYAVAGAGDVDGDGYNDVIVGAYGYSSGLGRAYVYTGSVVGLNTSAFATFTGSTSAYLGYSVDGAGDIGGDGLDDVIVGAYGYSSGIGAAYVYAGSATSMSTTTTLLGDSAEELGTSVAGAGDVDGDGFDDVIVGAPGYFDETGRAYVFQGSASGLSTTASVTLTGTATSAAFGTSVAGVGDLDADGYDDLLVGAPGDGSYGRVYLYEGAAGGISTTASRTLTYASATQFGTLVAPGGDVNGDGWRDVLVGDAVSTYVYHGAAAGLSLTTGLKGGDTLATLDANGDGYTDVAVGSSTYSSSTGVVYVYAGASAGIAWRTYTTLNGYNVGDEYGGALAGVDLDGDGYDDLAIGAPGYSGDRGRIYVYPGTSAGVSTSVSSAVAGTDANDRLADALAGMGDLDGDGYADLAASATGAEAVYVYPGGASGLSSTAADSVSGCGTALANAGDVTGDGADDILTGCAGAGSDAGSAALFEAYVDADGDGVAAGTDCDDGDASLTGPVTAWADADGDGYGDPDVTAEVCGTTAGYVSNDEDCDDGDAATSPAGTEACDDADQDEDCDGVAEEAGASGEASYYVDADEDGHGGAVAGLACDTPAGFAAAGDDCDDGDPSVSPSEVERCDGDDTDEDCNGLAEDADAGATGKTTVYTDADGDGYGGAAAAFCDPPAAGYLATSTDCDDGDAAAHPAATEVCDGADADEDCDGLADDADSSATGQSTVYVDADRDGYGGSTTALRCDLSAGYAASASDCDDGNASAWPGATEVCDALNTDEDCDGLADDADPGASEKSIYYADADGDGHGGPMTSSWCDPPTGYTSASTDCDDALATIHPGATELCDAADSDEDCDGLADDFDSSATGKSTFYLDADGDGHGSSTTGSACDRPAGYATTADDCDDAAAETYPGAADTVADGVDGDCDGGETCYADADADGYRASTTLASADGDCADAGEALAAAVADCDDADAATHGGAAEVVGDGIDENCDGAELCYADEDGDGYRPDEDSTVASEDLDCEDLGEAAADTPAGDCDDLVAAFHPGAEEPNCVDPNDYNCDGSVGYADADGDGFAACEECDDQRTAVNPEAAEVCNGLDDDCDGGVDVGATDAATWSADADDDGFTDPSDTVEACDAPDGYGAASEEDDCDDADPATFPGAEEVAGDGVDQDCDGDDASEVGDRSDSGGAPKSDEGCACAATGAPMAALPALLLALVAAVRGRRRRR